MPTSGTPCRHRWTERMLGPQRSALHCQDVIDSLLEMICTLVFEESYGMSDAEMKRDVKVHMELARCCGRNIVSGRRPCFWLKAVALTSEYFLGLRNM
jgi:hypothetical protein